jgi:hypothetical protein
VVELYGVINNYGGRPTASQVQRMNALETEIQEIDSAFQLMMKKELEKINQDLAKEKLNLLTVPTLKEYQEKNQ